MKALTITAALIATLAFASTASAGCMGNSEKSAEAPTVQPSAGS